MALPNKDRMGTLFNTLRAVVTTLLVCVLFVHILKAFHDVTLLLGLALVFTYLLLGPVNLLERGIVAISKRLRSRGWFRSLAHQTPEVNPRILAVVTVYFSFFMILVISTTLFFPLLSRQITEFGKALPRYIDQTQSAVMEWSDKTLGPGTLKQIFAADIKRAEEEAGVKTESPSSHGPITENEKQVIQQSVINSALTQAANILEAWANSALENLFALITHTLTGLIYFLTALVLIFYFLLDGPKLRAGFVRMLPSGSRETVSFFLDSFHQVMFTFVKGQVFLAFVSGTLMFILYTIFHVQYAFFLSTFFTIAEIVPVIGPWFAFTPGILVMLFSDHPEVTLYVLGIYFAIKDNIILPKVVGEVMGLHPVVVIMAMLVCAKVGGLLGVVLAIPLASALNVTLVYFLQRAWEDLPASAVETDAALGEAAS